MGKQVDITGALSAYFSHPGMTGQPQPVHRPPRVGRRDLELIAGLETPDIR